MCGLAPQKNVPEPKKKKIKRKTTLIASGAAIISAGVLLIEQNNLFGLALIALGAFSIGLKEIIETKLYN